MSRATAGPGRESITWCSCKGTGHGCALRATRGDPVRGHPRARNRPLAAEHRLVFSTEDTIVAIATPPGRGGIGVVRISGPAARVIGSAVTQTSEFEPRRATLARAAVGTVHDRVVVTFFPAPASYTGEDVVELSAHGSPVVLHAIVEAAMAAGARLAEPGEFTLRAYLHGRMDLVQAEAVKDLIDAVTPLQARAAFDQLDGTLTTRIREIDAALFDLSARVEASLDFPEEGYHFVEPGRVADGTRQRLRSDHGAPLTRAARTTRA